MVTGITPQLATEEGTPRQISFELINQQLPQPGTCALGYNSIRFDDEFTRYGLYRNFFDPYAREWQNGNWPLLLNRAEQQRWHEYRIHRLTKPEAGASITYREYGKVLSRMTVGGGLSQAQRSMLNELLDWPANIGLGEAANTDSELTL